jgi:hypothetical protein
MTTQTTTCPRWCTTEHTPRRRELDGDTIHDADLAQDGYCTVNVHLVEEAGQTIVYVGEHRMEATDATDAVTRLRGLAVLAEAAAVRLEEMSS